MLSRGRRICISYILFLGFCLLVIPKSSFSINPANGPGKLISKKDLSRDIDRLVSLLEEAHADPYRMIESKDFYQLVHKTKVMMSEEKNNSLRLMDCYFILQEIVAAIQGEHTYVNFPFDALSDSELFLPIRIKSIDGSLYNIENIGPEEIPVYAEILEINEIPTQSVYERCQKYLYFPLKHSKASLFERMIHFYLVSLFDKHTPWKIRFNDGSQVKSITIKGITGEELSQEFSLPQVYKKYTIDIRGSDVPVLDIPNFFYGRFQDYQKFIDDFFAEHTEKDYLVIDLRGNPGGNGTWGYYMLDFLTDSPYRIIDVFDFKVSGTFRQSNYRNKAKNSLKRATDGSYIPSDEKRIKDPGKSGRKFKGKSFLLTSNTTNSAGVVTAAIFQHSRMGSIIGQETAGRLKFCSDPVTRRLPHTGLEVNIPVAIYALPGDNPDRGVIPDIIINYSLDDLINKRDLEMEKVRELIKSELR